MQWMPDGYQRLLAFGAGLYDTGEMENRKLTKTEILYERWLDGGEEEKKKAVHDLTNICAGACLGLCPPFQRDEYQDRRQNNAEFNKRFRQRRPWCHEFVLAELRSRPIDDCRYIGRRARQRLIDAIRSAHRQPRDVYLASVDRDRKGRFMKAWVPGQANPRQHP